MTIQYHAVSQVPFTALTGADWNPRSISDAEMAKLKRSIREFGFCEPVAARAEDHLVLGGHQRLTALRLIAEETGQPLDAIMVPTVLVAGISDDETPMLNIALNKISGTWDFAKLAAVFQSLGGLSPDSIALSGYDSGEIDQVVKLGVELGHINDPYAEGSPDGRARFSFDVETDEQAALLRETLMRFGMTGPGNITAAFLSMVRATINVSVEAGE